MARWGAGLVAAALVATVGGLPTSASAGGGVPIVVTTTADVVNGSDGLTSLREAVTAVASDPTTSEVVLAEGTIYGLTSCGGAGQEDANADGDLDLVGDRPFVITGHGSTIRQTCAGERVLHVVGPSTASLAVEGVRVAEGRLGGVLAPGLVSLVESEVLWNRSPTAGGGINAADVVLNRSTVGWNRAEGDGGGIFATGTVTAANSTFAGNVAEGAGGAVQADVVELEFATFSADRAQSPGREIVAQTLVAEASVISAEYPYNLPDPVACAVGASSSLGANADGDGSCGLDTPADLEVPSDILDAAFATHVLDLAPQGGPTYTAPASSLSVLMDAGPATCTGTDQRGRPRLVGAACDIGAVEVDPATFDVTTTADVVDPDDGELSLREAIEDSAAVAHEPVSVELEDGASYVLGCAAGGDLDPNGVVDITIEAASTIEQSCANKGSLTVYSGAVRLGGLTVTASAEGAGEMWLPLGRVHDVTVRSTGGTQATIVFSESPAALVGSRFEDNTNEQGLITLWGGGRVEHTTTTGNQTGWGISGEVGPLHVADVTVRDSTFAGSPAIFGCSDLTVERSVVSGTTASVGVLAVECESEPVHLTVRSSSVVGNTFGGGDNDDEGAISVRLGSAEVVNSTVAGNTGEDRSAGISVPTGSLDLQHTTIVHNAVPVGEAAVEAASLSAVASVIEGPAGACAIAGSTGSGGGNVAGDATCGFDHASDQVSVADLGLEPLDLGDAMPVLVPEPSSPLVDAITAPGCGSVLPLDQRGLPRPSPQPIGDCDAGAVELQQPFSEVPLTHRFFSDIGWAAEQGIAGGFPDGSYRPGAAVARQAMAAFLYRLAGEPAVDPPAEATFSDVPVTSTFFAEIEWLVAEGIAEGFADGTFRPGQAVSRQAMAAFLYRFEGEPTFLPPGTPSFSDVAAGSTFFHEVEWLTDVGVAEGFPDGTFRPAQAVTRQAMAAFLHRLAEL